MRCAVVVLNMGMKGGCVDGADSKPHHVGPSGAA